MVSSQVFDRCFVRFALLVAFSLTTLPRISTAQILPGGPAPTLFLPPENVSNNAGTSGSQQVVVDNQGNIDLVWSDNTPGYQAVFFSRSTDLGLTFSNPQDLSNDPNGSSQPKIAVDQNGTIYVVWGVYSTRSAYLTSSSDGTNFSAPSKISDNVLQTVNVAVGTDGCANVGWAGASQYHSLFFSRSCDGGATFSAPLLVSTTNPFAGTPLMAVDSSGNIDLVWEGCYSYCQIWFSQSSDEGSSFTPQLELAGTLEAGVPVAMNLGLDGSINVVFNTVPWGNIYLARSTDGGKSFIEANVSNNASGRFSNPTDAQVGVDSNGNIYVVWDASAAYLSKSSDQGATFSSQIIGDAITRSYRPQIAIDLHGNINLIWTSYSGTYDIFFSRSTDAGATFSAPQNLSNGSIGTFGPTTQIALDSLGNAYVTWTNSDIFFTRSVTIPTAPPALPLKPLL